MRLLPALLAASLAAPTTGCAVVTGTVAAATDQWPTTSTVENRTWLDGEPTTSVVVAALLETPPRAICTTHRSEPASRVVSDSYGFDTGGRVAYGFIGAMELGLAAAIAFLPRAVETEDGWRQTDARGLDVAAAIIGLDGLATIALAFLIPDSHYHHERVDGPRELVSPTCPPDAYFEVDGRPLPLQPDGHLTAQDAHSLMLWAAEHGGPIVLVHRQIRTATHVPPDLRCAWAVERGSPLAESLCPHRPPPVRPPPVPVLPGPR